VAPDALALLGLAPDPDRAGPGRAGPGRAAKLTRSQLVSALRTARRHHVEVKADMLLAVLRAPALRQAATLQGAYAAVVTTRTLTSTSASRASRSSSRGARLASSATTRTGPPVRVPARTTPGRARSPAPRARRASCWPAKPSTAASAPRCTCTPSPRSAHRLVHQFPTNGPKSAENRVTRSSRETPNVEHRKRNGSGPRRARTDDLRIKSP